MKIGVVFPTTEIGNDPAAIRDFAQSAEDLAYDHIDLEEHVLGADPNREGGWTWGPAGAGRPGVTKDAAIHEPFVLCGYLAACTRRIELATAVLVLPQRQTALVAKQAAEVDILSGGRLRLGVGAGWNPVEFQGLGADFHTRGRRQEEQIRLLRRLWQEDVVDFSGRFHRVELAGINPLPGRRIPIWLGGVSDAALRRAARLADGYMPLSLQPGDAAAEFKQRLHAYLAEAGRSPAEFGIEVWTGVRSGDPDAWRRALDGWRDYGATHATLRLYGLQSPGPDRYIDAMRRYMEAVSG